MCKQRQWIWWWSPTEWWNDNKVWSCGGVCALCNKKIAPDLTAILDSTTFWANEQIETLPIPWDEDA